MQRLLCEALNVSAFYLLGWIRLEIIIETKKVLFILSIMALRANGPSKQIFYVSRFSPLGSAYSHGHTGIAKTVE